MQLATTKAKASLRRYNQLFLLVAVLIIATVISRGVFVRPANLMVVTASAAAFGLVSFGQALVVIGGGFDLTVGSLMAMSISTFVFFCFLHARPVSSTLECLFVTGGVVAVESVAAHQLLAVSEREQCEQKLLKQVRDAVVEFSKVFFIHFQVSEGYGYFA